MIICQNMLSELGMVLYFKSQIVKWDENEKPMKPAKSTTEKDYHINDLECINI